MNNNGMKNKEVQNDTVQELPVKAITQAVVKKKQIELSEDDFTRLNDASFSSKVWEDIARKHSFDPDTIEALPGVRRAYLAVPKRWQPLPPKTGGILTTTKIGR